MQMIGAFQAETDNGVYLAVIVYESSDNRQLEYRTSDGQAVDLVDEKTLEISATGQVLRRVE